MTHILKGDLPTLERVPREYPDLERLGIFSQYTMQFVSHCPKCHGILHYPSGGGVKCVAKGCGYWFCY